jgi:galactose mutarotase-like enzyme
LGLKFGKCKHFEANAKIIEEDTMNYTIKNENIEITVRSTGAELINLKSPQGTEYIWQRDPVFWNRCAPILFPAVGRLRDKYTVIDEKNYVMDIHGFLKDEEFELKEATAESLCFVNRYSEATLKMYPFRYETSVTYTIKKNTVRTAIRVRNLDERDLPFNLGGHPAFNCPLYQNDKFTDYSVNFEVAEYFDGPTIEKNGTLNFDKPAVRFDNLKKLSLERNLFSIDTIVIPKVQSRFVKLLNQKGRGVKFSFPGFSTFAIWTRYNQEALFICLEPWIGYGDRFDSNHQFLKKDDLVVLKPKQEFHVHYEMEIIE